MTENICFPICTNSNLATIRLVIRSIILLIRRLAPAIAFREEGVCTIRSSTTLTRINKYSAIFQSHTTAITSGRRFFRIFKHPGYLIINTEMFSICTWSRIRQDHHILIRNDRSTERTHTRFCPNCCKPQLRTTVCTTFYSI